MFRNQKKIEKSYEDVHYPEINQLIKLKIEKIEFWGFYLT